MPFKEYNSFQQAFQYITVSANNLLFNKKKSALNDLSSLRSLSDMSISSYDSSDLDEDDQHKEMYDQEPWKLNSIFRYREKQHDYFFVDRDELSSCKNYCIDDIERDSYGFKRPTQWIKLIHLHQFDIYYQPILNKQRNNWSDLLSRQTWPLKDSPQLIECVREGVPSALRGKVWMHYSGAQTKMENNPDLYQSLVNTASALGDNNEFAEIIQRDLHRTFPDNSKFAGQFFRDPDGTLKLETNSKLESLQRLLLAFSVYSPQIGYCQSLNYLAGFFLLFLETEQEAFWMLVTTIHDFMPENMYDATMEGAHLDQRVLMLFIKEKLPLVWEKFQVPPMSNKLPPITLVTSHWFLTLFINILPIETVLRIWDCFFVEGYAIMFQVALTIIQMNQEKILDLQDPIELFQILQNMPRRLIDCHQFMNNVFSLDNVACFIDLNDIVTKRESIKACK